MAENFFHFEINTILFCLQFMESFCYVVLSVLILLRNDLSILSVDFLVS